MHWTQQKITFIWILFGWWILLLTWNRVTCEWMEPSTGSSFFHFWGLNMQMRHYLFNEICANLHKCLQKSKHWMKSVSKFLFNFSDILESNVLTEGMLGISFLSLYNSENTDRKQYIFTILGGIKCCIQSSKLYMNKSFPEKSTGYRQE